MKNRKINLLRTVFSLSCLCLFTFSINAQERTETGTESVKRISYGFKVGATMSRFSSEQPHINFKPGLTAGIFISYPLSSNFALQLEPAYLQQGGNQISIMDYPMFLVPDPPFLLEIRDQNVTFHNIDIPLLVKFEKTIAGLKLFALAGPSIGFNLNAETRNNVSARSWDQIPIYYNFYQEENITSNIEPLHYGAIGGIGFETPVGTHKIIFDVKYRYSLNNTYKGYSYLGIQQIQGDLQTNTLYFTLGFGF